MSSTDPSQVILRTLPNCRRCGIAMEFGSLLDYGDSNVVRHSYWIPGKIDRTFWGLLKQDKARQAIPVFALRCPACGLLELYAPPPAAPPQTP